MPVFNLRISRSRKLRSICVKLALYSCIIPTYGCYKTSAGPYISYWEFKSLIVKSGDSTRILTFSCSSITLLSSFSSSEFAYSGSSTTGLSLNGWLKTRYLMLILLCLRYEIRASLSSCTFRNLSRPPYWLPLCATPTVNILSENCLCRFSPNEQLVKLQIKAMSFAGCWFFVGLDLKKLKMPFIYNY